MKNLIEYIKESLLDDGDSIVKNVDKDIKQRIKQFINDNYSGAVSRCKISKHPDNDGKYIVDCKGTLGVKNKNIPSLTNEYFKFGVIDGGFSCRFSNSITSLEGAPERVGKHFHCTSCDSLASLEGAPEEVGRDFSCMFCASLKTLVGSPKKVGGDFYCSFCDSLESLEGCPEHVGGNFDCGECGNLTSIDNKPKHVGGTIKS